jgi:hypothetical protein
MQDIVGFKMEDGHGWFKVEGLMFKVKGVIVIIFS